MTYYRATWIAAALAVVTIFLLVVLTEPRASAKPTVPTTANADPLRPIPRP